MSAVLLYLRGVAEAALPFAAAGVVAGLLAGAYDRLAQKFGWER